MRFRLLLPVLLAIHTVAASAEIPSEGAKLSGGVACYINPTNVSDALELARQGRFLVFVAEADEARASEFRGQAEGCRSSGRSLYVEQLADEGLPLADHVVDLVVAPEATDDNEIMRVLSPVRGKAFVGKRVLRKPAPANSDDWTHRLHAADNNPVSQDSAFQGPAMLQYLAMPMQDELSGHDAGRKRATN